MYVWSQQRRFTLRFKARMGPPEKKKCDFELEICVIERGGRAARCMGRAPVAQMLASVTRRSPPTASDSVRQRPGGMRLPTPLTVFSRAIDRESLAGVWQLLQTTY